MVFWGGLTMSVVLTATAVGLFWSLKNDIAAAAGHAVAAKKRADEVSALHVKQMGQLVTVLKHLRCAREADCKFLDLDLELDQEG
jgi:hypothetical protein